MLRIILPYMRAQKSGVIANLGSIGGWRGTPVAGIYCSTKFAVAGISQSLKAEVEALGIEVTCIEPGGRKKPTDDIHSANMDTRLLSHGLPDRWPPSASDKLHNRLQANDRPDACYIQCLQPKAAR